MKPFLAPEPANDRRTNQHLDLSSYLIQQGSGFQRALSSTKYGHLFPSERVQITVVTSMRSQRGRNSLELRWTPGKRFNSSRNNDSPRFPGFPVFQGKPKPRSVLLDAIDFPRIRAWHDLR